MTKKIGLKTSNMVNYEDTCAAFVWRRPEKFNFARDVIDQWAARHSDRPALLWVDERGTQITRTYLDVSIASRKLCNLLHRLGIRRGDTLIVLLGRSLEWWETLTACLRMGVIASPGTTQLTAMDLVYRVNASNATCVITDTANAPKLESVIRECPSIRAKLLIDGTRTGWISYVSAVANAAPDFETADTRSDEAALCYFTSGTTGHPKMCMHAHSYGLGHSITGRYWLDLGVSDLHWNISDTGWAKAAWSSYFGPWTCGATVFVYHAATFEAARTLELLQRYPITTMCAAPTIYRMLVLEDLSKYEFPHLRHCVGAGEPLNPEIIKTWRTATGTTIRDGYGQTETTILCASFPCIEPRLGSMGKPAPGVKLAILNEAGAIVKANIEGDIAVKVKPEPPQGFFLEYKDKPEMTACTFKGDWYLTGDRGYQDEAGYFWFVGRGDDVILSAGYRIGPFEVESALLEHAAVAESAVVSSPDETRGEIVKAFVILAPGHEGTTMLKKELQEHVKSVTAPYKYPRAIEFVAALPKTVSGKIKRGDLRKREWSKT